MLTIVKSMYMHLGTTLPIYMYRSIGEKSHFAYLMIIHQVVLLVFVPILTSLVRYFDFYRLLEIGSFITAISPIFLLLGNNYWTLGLFMIVISIGESIYAPRLADYTIAIAPKGKEAIYLGLANTPNSLSILITGISSGFLLAGFCPQDGEQNCPVVWYMIGGYSLIACFIITLGRSFFEEFKPRSEEKEKEKEILLNPI